jgi:hypothetical protein
MNHEKTFEAINKLKQVEIELHRLKNALEMTNREYERGFIDGMQKQMESSVDKAVNAMTKPTYYIPSKDQRKWIGLTDEEIQECLRGLPTQTIDVYARRIEAKLKEKNDT